MRFVRFAAVLIAGVSLVSPSPIAPKSFTLNVFVGNCGTGKFGGVNGFSAAWSDQVANATNPR